MRGEQTHFADDVSGRRSGHACCDRGFVHAPLGGHAQAGAAVCRLQTRWESPRGPGPWPVDEWRRHGPVACALHSAEVPSLRFSTGEGKEGDEETQRERGRERNARYADAELDVFGFARYCCHAVLHGRIEAREPFQVRLIRRREGLRRYRVRVYINIHVRMEYVRSHVGSNSINPADSYGLGYETKE